MSRRAKITRLQIVGAGIFCLLTLLSFATTGESADRELLTGASTDPAPRPAIVADTPATRPEIRQSISTASNGRPKAGQRVVRSGDEIMVCGQLFHTTAPV